MSKVIRQFTLSRQRSEPQPVDMPKRARIISVLCVGSKVAIDTEVEEDANTRAFDRAHQRYFQVVSAGDLVPEGVLVDSFVAASAERQTRVYHVYEVRGR